MKKKSKKLLRPVRSAKVPATSEMLGRMEDRLIHRMDSGFEKLRAEISGARAEISGVKGELKNDILAIKSDIHVIRSDIHGMKSELHRVALLVEEQNARNKFVMDGYAQIYQLLTAK